MKSIRIATCTIVALMIATALEIALAWQYMLRYNTNPDLLTSNEDKAIFCIAFCVFFGILYHVAFKKK